MTVLALDLGAAYGFAIISPTGEIVASGARNLRGDAGGPRLACLHNSLCDLVTEYAPEHIAIEKPIHAGRFTAFGTARALYEYAGLAALIAHWREIGFVEINRMSAYKAVLGRGNAKKDDALAYVRDTLGIANASQDEADAVIVGLAVHADREDVG
jgi:Holliday junction resolvasome RuvABC endonuclease subunit